MSNKVDLIMSRLLIKGAVKVKMNPASGARSFNIDASHSRRDALVLMDGIRITFSKMSDVRNTLEKNAFYIEGWQ